MASPAVNPHPMASHPDGMWGPPPPPGREASNRSVSVPPRMRPRGVAGADGPRSRLSSGGGALAGGVTTSAGVTASGFIGRGSGAPAPSNEGQSFRSPAPCWPLPSRVRGHTEEVVVGCPPSSIGYGEKVFVPVKGSRLPPSVVGSLPLSRLLPAIAGPGGRQIRKSQTTML